MINLFFVRLFFVKPEVDLCSFKWTAAKQQQKRRAEEQNDDGKRVGNGEGGKEPDYSRLDGI